jgi:hypothetical protein
MKQPEKWYALTAHSAQSHSMLREHREQTNKPLAYTKPSDNPYSIPPARVNKFHDISPNPRLLDPTKKKKSSHHNSDGSGAHKGVHISHGENRDPGSPDPGEKSNRPNGGKKEGAPSFGLICKCNNPFTEGWKIATFKPAREKLVPYTATVKKFWKHRGYGFLDYRGQEVFVHMNDVTVPVSFYLCMYVVCM